MKAAAILVILSTFSAVHARAAAPSEALSINKMILRAEPSVAIQIDIVSASKEDGAVDASLGNMRNALSSKVKYGTLKKLSTQTMSIDAKPKTVSLPDSNNASIALESLKDSVATVHVKVPPTDATYTLAKGKSLYLQAGSHEGADLWLVLSQPKR